MYYEQQILATLVRDQGLISGAAVARAAGCSTAHLYSLMQGNRRVPMHVWNAMLRLIDGTSARDPVRYWAITAPTLALLIDGTTLYAGKNDNIDTTTPVDRLCTETSILVKNMAGLLASLGEILVDGQINDRDDATLEEFYAQRAELDRHTLSLEKRLKHDRAKCGKGSA